MKQIFKKFFIDYISDGILEVVYALSFFAFLIFSVIVVFIHNDMLKTHDSRYQSIMKAADKDITENIILPEDKTVLETLEVQEMENTPAEEPEENTKNVPAEKIAPQKRIKNINKNVIAGAINAPSLSGSFKKDNQGRKVCSSKSDDPHKSNQNTSVHIDKECCLDPDEIPNPRCHYSSNKYGKLLAKYEKKKTKFLERYRKNH